MGRIPTAYRWIITACGAALALGTSLGVSGCTGATTTPDTPRSSAPAGSSSPTTGQSNVSAQIRQYIAKADQANAQQPNTVLRASARPTVVQQDAGTQTMVIRDEDRTAWQKGSYRLVVYCVGSGTLYAHVTIGAAAKIEELPPCNPQITTGTVDVTVPSDTSGSLVVIVPAGIVHAAVAYQIQRQ